MLGPKDEFRRFYLSIIVVVVVLVCIPWVLGSLSAVIKFIRNIFIP